MLTIKWQSGDAKGYSDEIPNTWIVSREPQQMVKHYVIGPKGAAHIAWCDIHPQEAAVEIDYTAYRRQNERNGVDIGILRLEFADSNRSGTPNVYWKDNFVDDFTSRTADTKVSWQSDIAKADASGTKQFDVEVTNAEKLGDDELLEKIRERPALPRRRQIKTTLFLRNPFVIAYVLRQANGHCQVCGSPAPFASRTTGKPYLEVHHKKRLADGGEDTPENAIALCPNCHRKKHFG